MVDPDGGTGKVGDEAIGPGDIWPVDGPAPITIEAVNPGFLG